MVQLVTGRDFDFFLFYIHSLCSKDSMGIDVKRNSNEKGFNEVRVFLVLLKVFQVQRCPF